MPRLTGELSHQLVRVCSVLVAAVYIADGTRSQQRGRESGIDSAGFSKGFAESHWSRAIHDFQMFSDDPGLCRNFQSLNVSVPHRYAGLGSHYCIGQGRMKDVPVWRRKKVGVAI